MVPVQRAKVVRVGTDDGKCVGRPELRLLRRDLLTVPSGIGEGRPFETQRVQAPMKSMGRRAKIGCQNLGERGHYVPQPYSVPKRARGPCENQVTGESLAAGTSGVGL